MSVLFRRRGPAPSLGKKASDFAIGDSVFLIENDAEVEYLVVQQGIPDSALYDASCDGTWLLRKDLYGEWRWAGYYNYYADCYVHRDLNDVFLPLLGESVQAAIKDVKIPHVNNNGNAGSVASGANGLSTKVFLLSCCEVGVPSSATSIVPGDGATLDFFEEHNTDADRIAYMGATVKKWWLRSPQLQNEINVYYINTSGKYTSTSAEISCGIRPALIIDKDTKFDPDTNVIL